MKITKNILSFLIVFLFFTSMNAQEKQKQTIVPFYDYETSLFGFKDSLLNMAAIPAKYQFADRFYEGVARIQQDDKWGFIAFSGKEITPVIYEDAFNIREGLAAVKLNGKWGFIDRTGKEVIPFNYMLASSFSEDRAAVSNGEFWGFIDSKGHLGIEHMFGYDENVYPIFKEGLANVKFREKYGYIGTLGQIIIKFEYDYALPFKDGLAAVEKDFYWGFINKKGKEIVKIKYEISDTFPIFKDGLCPVSVNGKYGYVNTNGQEVIPLIYDYAANFEKGKAPVRLGSMSFNINTSGERIEE